jgi:hypothetical protein
MTEPLGTPARTVPATAPPTSADVLSERDVASAAQTQLADVRKAAESWRNGLAGLLTLITAVLFLKGKSSIDDLAEWARFTVALLLTGALIVGAIGTWWSLRAAYGEPTVITTDYIKSKGGMAAYRAELAENSISDLRGARVMAYTTLALVTVSVFMTWFAPGPPSP